jgi:hypothetical protein
VGDAAGQSADRLEFVGFPQLFLEPEPFFLRSLFFGEIQGQGIEAGDRVIAIGYRDIGAFPPLLGTVGQEGPEFEMRFPAGENLLDGMRLSKSRFKWLDRCRSARV